MTDKEKYINKKVYIVFNAEGERIAIGNGKNIYITKGHITSSITHQLKYEKNYARYDNYDSKELIEKKAKESLEKRYKGFKVVEYELKPTGKEIDLNEFIK